MRDPATPFQTLHGRLRDARATAFAVVRNEIYYLPSFLDHHRRLGIDQFIILDDQSTDGTRELLISQPDCVVLEWPFAYGERLVVPGSRPERHERAGILVKSLIPQRHLAGRYAVCLDADELLMLPEGVTSVGDLFDVLARNGIPSVAAGLIDFYPRAAGDMDVQRELLTSQQMLGAHPYFDAVPLIGWREGATSPYRTYDGATARLFRKHGIRHLPAWARGAPRWLRRNLPFRYPTPSVLKTPVVLWTPGVEYMNSHKANVPCTGQIVVGLAHMKFTHDLSRRVAYAIASGGYTRGSEKYVSYQALLESMRGGDPSFLGPESRSYTGPADLGAAGLTRLDLE